MADEEKPAEQSAPPAEPKPEASEEKKGKKNKKEDDAEYKGSKTIHIKLYSPYKTYYDGDAESVSAENRTGPFDVLPQHHNFITLLRECEVDIKSTQTGDTRIKITRGIMHVRRNQVTIFLDV